MNDESASGALAGAVTAALRAVRGLSQVSEGVPVAGGDGVATVELGPETDWGHKSGAGAELRLAVTIGCGGERPERLRALLAAARAAAEAIGPALGPSSGTGWRLVTLVMVRARATREGPLRWRGTVDYRARLLRDG